MNFFAENLRVFKKVFMPVLALMVLSSSIDQTINLHLENALLDPSGAQRPVFFLGFFALLSSIIFPVLLAVITLYGLNSLHGWPITLGSFLKKHLNQLYIETLRSWGKTLSWSLLLIVPGIWKFLSYALVPMVVTSSRRYEAGQEDALEASSRIVRRRWFAVLCVLVLFQLFIPMILASIFSSYRLIWKTPLASLGLSGLDAYLFLISTQILFNIFRREDQKYDAHV